MFGINKILKQAWGITKTNKFLYLFGLFLVWGNVINFALVWFNDNQAQANPQNSSNVEGIVGLIILISFIFLYFRSKAGLIIAIKALIDKQQTSFRKAFSVSRLFYSRILSISVIILSVLILLVWVLAVPVNYFYIHENIIAAWSLGIFGSLIFIPAALVILLVNILSQMFVAIFDLTLKEAASKSFDLISMHWLKLVLFGFLLLVFEILPVVFLQILAYYIHGLMWSFIVLILFFCIEIVIVTFNQAAWVLLFLELIKPQKLDEEVVIAPEIAGG